MRSPDITICFTLENAMTDTGKEVWQVDLPAGGQTTPMTYAVDDRQYVVIAPGGHHFMETKVGDEVIAYALPAG